MTVDSLRLERGLQTSVFEALCQMPNITKRCATQAYLDPASASTSASRTATAASTSTGLAKRVIACLDVRSNDQGDLVVTKVGLHNRRGCVDDPNYQAKSSDRSGDEVAPPVSVPVLIIIFMYIPRVTSTMSGRRVGSGT